MAVYGQYCPVRKLNIAQKYMFYLLYYTEWIKKAVIV